MRFFLIMICCLVVLPVTAQRLKSTGTLSGMFFMGVTPEDPKIGDKAKFYFEFTMEDRPYRYPAQVTVDAPGHRFRYICKAKDIPTDIPLRDMRLVIIEKDRSASVAVPDNFDGDVLLLSSPRATIAVDGKKYRAKKPLQISATESRVRCPAGLKSVAGLRFTWRAVDQ